MWDATIGKPSNRDKGTAPAAMTPGRIRTANDSGRRFKEAGEPKSSTYTIRLLPAFFGKNGWPKERRGMGEKGNAPTFGRVSERFYFGELWSETTIIGEINAGIITGYDSKKGGMESRKRAFYKGKRGKLAKGNKAGRRPFNSTRTPR